MNRRAWIGTATAGAAGSLWAAAAGPVFFGGAGGPRLLNCSYDATRELYRRLNRLFADHWLAETGAAVRVTPSHGGSGSQARAVMDGLPADVVTLALWPDTDAVRKKGLINGGKPGWEERLPHRSCPYTSTIVFVVRKDNPHAIHDWADLADSTGKRARMTIVAANPQTSGAAKLGVIACWGSVTTRGGSEREAEERVLAVYRKVGALETSSRAASVSFSRKGIGDVQITWENEAILEVREGRGALEIVYPSRSLLAEPHVAVVDAVAERRGTADLARAYLKFLYSAPAQRVFAEGAFRPTAVPSGAFPDFPRFGVDAALGAPAGEGWDAATDRLFRENGVFSRVFKT